MAKSRSGSRSSSTSPEKSKSPKQKQKKAYVRLTRDIMQKLAESIDSDWDRMKGILIPSSKKKQGMMVELIQSINQFLAIGVPDGQMPPHILPRHLALWLTSCMKKAGKWDAQLADEQKHGGDRRSSADNIENEDHKMLWITIFNKYHEDFDDKGREHS